MEWQADIFPICYDIKDKKINDDIYFDFNVVDDVSVGKFNAYSIPRTRRKTRSFKHHHNCSNLPLGHIRCVHNLDVADNALCDFCWQSDGDFIQYYWRPVEFCVHDYMQTF